MNKNVSIVDYGLGNILSAKQSFLKVAKENKIISDIKITSDPNEVKKSTHIVLPGQGAFESCMTGLKNIPGMIEQLEESVINKKIYFLGICVGMQLLANKSYENGEHLGLGWISGKIIKLSPNTKLPHIGWNEVQISNNNNLIKSKEIKDYYFVHSYYFECENKKNIAGITNYGIDFTSFVQKENIYGVQFHPEKSSDQGLEIIKNFLLL